jgi:hypothetical protein
MASPSSFCVLPAASVSYSKLARGVVPRSGETLRVDRAEQALAALLADVVEQHLEKLARVEHVLALALSMANMDTPDHLNGSI